LRIQIVEGAYGVLIAGLRTGEIDMLVGALRGPALYEDIEERWLFDDTLSLVVRRDHPLTRTNAVAISDTIGYPWIVPRAGTPTRSLFHAAFRSRALLEPKRLLEVSSTVSLRALLLESDRIAIVSRRQIAHEEEEGRLVVLPVDLPETRRPIGLTVRRDWEPSRAHKDLLRHLRTVAEDWAANAVAAEGRAAGSEKFERVLARHGKKVVG
jgi:LysR family transcriptional regulator, regulator for genes of the gallate degradation pathway